MAGANRLADVVGREDGHAAGPQVLGRGRERCPQVRLARHVADGVVDQHRVEGAPQAQRAHVADQVLALGIDRRADGQHRRRDVGQGELQPALEVRRHVPAAGTELQGGLQRPDDVFAHHAQGEGGLVRVLGGWRQEMEPGRQLVAVEIRRVPIAHGCTVPASRLAC